MKKFFYTTIVILSSICFNIYAQWVQTNGPYGRTVNCFTVQGSNIFAGTNEFGVYRTSDNGEHWFAVNNGVSNYNVISFLVNGNYIFAGTDNGLFRSTDSGDNWIAVNSGFPGPPLPACIKALAQNGSTLFAANFFFNGGGVFISTDYGSNWTITNLSDPFTEALAVKGSNLFAGTYGGGVYRSSDNGNNWIKVNYGLTDTAVTSLAVNGNFIFAGTSTGIFRSTNDGADWNAVNSGLPGSKITSLVINGSNVFAGTLGNGVFLSTNNGTDWTAVNSGLINPTIHGLTINNTGIFAGTRDGGVFTSTDNGSNWSVVNNGFPKTDVFSLYTDGNVVFAGTEGGGIYTTSDDGNNWEDSNFGLTHPYIYSFAESSTNLFVGTAGGGIFRSSDNGATWYSANSGIPPVQSFINSIAINEPNIFAGTNYGIFLSTNEGSNWNWAGLSNLNVLSIAIIGENIFGATQNDGVFLSTNNGINWTSINNGLTNTHLLSLAVSDGKLYAGTYCGGGVYNGGIFYTSDYGQSWIPAGLGGHSVFCMLFINSYLIAGTDGYVYVSSDNGTTWNNISDGLNFAWVHSLTATSTDVFAGTNYSGVLKRTLSGIVYVKDPIQEIPESFELQQNYPNPFNPGTKISWQSPVASWQTIKVFDVLGNEIATLVDEYKSAGNYEVEFNSVSHTREGGNLTSGIYFYQLKTGEYLETKKMILLK